MITAPLPRTWPSCTPSNSPAARVWSSTGTASRRTAGSSDGPSGDRPRAQYLACLQAEVEVQRRRVVQLDDEAGQRGHRLSMSPASAPRSARPGIVREGNGIPARTQTQGGGRSPIRLARCVPPPPARSAVRRDPLLTSRHSLACGDRRPGRDPGGRRARPYSADRRCTSPAVKRATFSYNQKTSGTCGRGPPASMPARRPSAAPGRNTSWRVAPGRLRPGPGPGTPAIARAHCRRYIPA